MADLDLGRVKRNVKKMVDMGAPETDIDAYISSEGTTIDAVRSFRAAPESQQSQDLRAELSAMTQKPNIPTPAYNGGAFRAATEGSQAGIMGGFDDEIGAGMIAPIHAAMDWAKGDGFDVGKNYTRLQQELDARKGARREAHPVASIGGEVAGGLALGGGLAKQGLTVAGKALPVVGKTGAAMLEGAGYGGLYGAGEAKPGERLEGAATGAAIGAAAGGALEKAGQGVSRFLANRNAPAAPAVEQLKQATDDLYAQARAANVALKEPAVQKLASNMEYAAGRLNKDLRPNTAGLVDDVKALAQKKSISLEELDELRQVVGQSMKNAQPQDVRTLQRMKVTLDNFADNIKPADITGDIKGFDLIKQARAINSRRAKAEVLSEVVEKAQNQATGFENGLVIHMRALANNKEKMKAFSPEERKMILDVVRRGSAHGVLRALGMLSPSSTFGGLMTGGVGVGSGILPAAALAGTGMAARSGAGALTRGKVNALQRAVASGQVPNYAALPNYARPFIGGGVAGTLEVPRLLEE